MTESISIENIRHSWFAHLLFGSDHSSIRTLVDSEGYDSSNLNVDLKVNGVQLRSEDFSCLLDQWSDKIEQQIKQKYDFNKSDQAVIEKAEQLIKERLGNIQEILYTVENDLWKLTIEG